MTADGQLFAGPIDDPRRYRVDPQSAQAPLGGGEGLVYRATHEATGDIVALKLLTAARPVDYGRIVTRSLPFSELRHPSVMSQREVFLGAGLAAQPPSDPAEYEVIYTVADWVDGERLTEFGRSEHWKSALRALAGLADGLAHLADLRSDAAPRGLVHRDVKPSNIRITPGGIAVLIDFGVARPLDDDDLTKGVGTYRWRAPEVLSGAAPTSTATDAWGLGATAYWLLVGEPPSLEGAASARERILESPRSRQLADPAGVAAHLASLLETSPARRPSDLRQWGCQLTAILRAGSPRPSRRSTVFALGMVAPAAALASVALLRLDNRPQAAVGQPASTGIATQATTTTPSVDAPSTSAASGNLEPSPYSVELIPEWVRAEPPLYPNSSAISPDGSVAALVDSQGSAAMWRLTDLSPIVLQPAPPFPPSPTRDVYSPWLDFSPDGNRFASGMNSNGTTVWDVATGKVIASLPTNGAPSWEGIGPAPAFTPDGRRIVTWRLNEDAYEIWNVDTGELAGYLNQDVIGFSSDIGQFAALGADGVVAVIDTSSLQEIGTMPASGRSITSMVPVGRRLVYSTASETRVHDLDTGADRLVYPLPAVQRAYGFVAGGSGVTLRTADGVIAFDPATGEDLLQGLGRTRYGYTELVGIDWESQLVSDDAGSVFAYFDEIGQPHVIDASTGTDRLLDDVPGVTVRLLLSDDGRTLATIDKAGVARIWETRSGRRLQVLDPSSVTDQAREQLMYHLAFAPALGAIVTGSGDASYDGPTLLVWRPAR